MSRLVVYLVAASVLIAWASAACNTKEATELDTGDCNCTDSSLVYDYKENVCKEESDLYCSVRFNLTGNASACPSGFTKNITEGKCVDVDECAMGTAECKTWQECYNTRGHYHCGCKDGYYSINSECISVDEYLNPNWNDCPQYAYDWSSGYKCRCYNKTMFNDTNSDGRSCVLNPGYTNCTKDSDTGIMCVAVSATGEQFFFPKAGYKLNDTTNEAEDINECTEAQNTQCWENSECKNLVDGGGYECTCQTGYEDTLFNGTIKECLLKKCIKAEVPNCVGEGLDCVDPCVTSGCLQDMCVLQNNLPTCTRNFTETIFYEPLTEDIFANSIMVWNPDEPISQVTQSLETVFGAGNVQLLPQNPEFQKFSLNVLGSMTLTDAKKRLDTYCVSLSQLPGYCELPGGIIIENVTSDFIPLLEDMCAVDPCPTDTHICNATTRTCICKDGGTNTYFNDKFELCDVATDLQNQLNDTEDALKITGAILGTLLGLSLVAIVVLVFFKKGKFCSS